MARRGVGAVAGSLCAADAPMRYEVSGVSFSFYTSDEIRKLSVKKIAEPHTFDSLGNAVAGGLHDPVLGPTDKLGTCKTCGLVYKNCPGHFGHVELAEPVYNPLLVRHLVPLLRSACWYCHRLRLTRNEMLAAIGTLKALRDGDLIAASAAKEILDMMRKGEKNEDAEGEGDGRGEDLVPLLYAGRKGGAREEEEGEMKRREVGVLAREDAVVHVQKLRREVLRDLSKRMISGISKCPHCLQPQAKTRVDDTKTKLLLDNFSPAAAACATASGHSGATMGPAVVPAEKGKRRRSSAAASAVQKEQQGETAVEEEIKVDSHTYVTPSRCREHMRKMWTADPLQTELLLLIYSSRTVFGLTPVTADIFFVDVLPVTPSRFRPVIEMASLKTEHPHTVLYKRIVALNNQLVVALSTTPEQKKAALEAQQEEEDGNTKKKKVTKELTRPEILMQLQECIQDLCVSPADRNKAPSIKATLEKKEGLFRKHMMGKRVNYAARSVISPDPYINENEIGLPHFFCMKLTYPEPVTPRNVERLKQQVINGPDVYPGANFIEDEFGNLMEIRKNNRQSRVSEAARLLTLAPGAPRAYKTVYRHLRDGDMALVNRQPTLHKPGIMGHAIRVLGRERTLRMHYSNCSTYNADFDGDEMNIHVPQGELPRAEAALIAFTDEQYLVPKDGTPLRGLIQDSVVTGVLLTKRDTFFNRSDFQQLLYACLHNVNEKHSILTPYPAILKPQQLWTGKQAASGVLNQVTVTLPPLNLEGNTKVNGALWGRGGYHHGPSQVLAALKANPKAKKSEDMTDTWSGANESTVVICDNELLCGVLDKSQFGATAFGLVHSCYELYGSRIAGLLLSVMGRLFVTYMQSFRGFTCALDDLAIKPDAEKERLITLSKANREARKVIRAYAGRGSTDAEAISIGLSECRRIQSKGAELDGLVKAEINKISSVVVEQCIPDGQVKPFPSNGMALMTGSGARGSNVNFSQIACLLGQQELEGRRVPVMVTGRTLPSFRAFDTSARSGGFVRDRFLTGIRPQEFYFHSMAGREGLIDTAVKTSRSGYLQRTLIKSLESLRVHYDYTVRDGDGSVVQFNYGEDALDVTRTCYLQKFKFWAQNFNALITRYNMADAAKYFCSKDIAKFSKELDLCLSDPESSDPVLSKHFPGESLGIVSEKFYSGLKDYIAKDPDHFFKGGKVPPKKFHGLMCLKYSRTLVDPGEAVGLLASQSIGEPSTQMTLNTFHLAGRGDVNVTLGMPRLRELLMFAKQDIATPTMTIQTKSKSRDDANKVAKLLSRLNLIDIVEDASVTESVQRKGSGLRVRNYLVRLKFKKEYSKILCEFNVSEKKFLGEALVSFEADLKAYVGKQLKMKPADIALEVGAVRATSLSATAPDTTSDSAEPGEAPEDDDKEDPETSEPAKGKKKGKARNEEGEEDMDADQREQQNKKKEYATYDDPEDEEKVQDPEEDEEKQDDKDAQGKGKGEDDQVVVVAKALSSRSERNFATPADRDVEMEDAEDGESGRPVVSADGVFAVSLQVPADRKVMMLQAVEHVVENTVVTESKGIKRCMVSSSKGKDGAPDTYFVQTEGVNFPILADFADLIDLNSVVSNDVAAVLNFFGVEAARRTIVDEVRKVFSVYGINVDPRHLGLVADFMTFLGSYRSCNRTGIDSSTSPLLKMSFETTGEFLTRAAMYREVDMMHSPAACLVVGQPMSHGTGCFEIRQLLEPPMPVREIEPEPMDEDVAENRDESAREAVEVPVKREAKVKGEAKREPN